MDEDSNSTSSSNNNNSTNNTNRPSTTNFASAMLKDVNVDEEGRPIGLFGEPWKNITVKSRRPFGMLLNIRGYSNMSKKDFIHAISLAYVNRDIYEANDDVISTRKTRNCPQTGFARASHFGTLGRRTSQKSCASIHFIPHGNLDEIVRTFRKTCKSSQLP